MNEAGIRTYLAAARRQWWVILLPALIVGGITFALARPDDAGSYRASATLAIDSALSADGTLSIDSPASGVPQRTSVELPAVTAAALVREVLSPAVVAEAAAEVPGETPASAGGWATAAVDQSEFTLTVTAEAVTAARAVALANALTTSYLSQRQQELSDAIVEEQRALEAQLASLDSQILALTARGGDPSQLETSRSGLEAQAQALAVLEFQNESQVGRTGIEPALPAIGASKEQATDPWVRGITGFAIGLVLGIALAALRETLDTRLRNRDQAEAIGALPVVAELPRDRDLKKRTKLPVLDRPDSPYAEAMRALHTSLRFRTSEVPLVSVVVTSPQRGDGRTTVAANLAAASALAGVRTILVSGDLREGDPLAALGADDRSDRASRLGLRNLLTPTGRSFDIREGADVLPSPESGGIPGVGLEAVSAVLVPTRVPNLQWLPAGSAPVRGPQPINPAELLSSARARATLAALRQLADFVVIDSPPTVVADSVLLATEADGVLMLAAVGETNRDALGRAMAIIRATPTRVLGLVLNRSTARAGYRNTGRASRGARPQPLTNGNGDGNGNGTNGHRSGRRSSSRRAGRR